MYQDSPSCIGVLRFPITLCPTDQVLPHRKLGRGNKRLLYLIKCLYQSTTLHVRCGTEGDLPKPIQANKGVRQGCILAPTLFNLSLNDLLGWCLGTDFHPPRLAEIKCPLLLYADDTVLLSLSKISLKRPIHICMSYCKNNQLVTNFGKTKIMVFAQSVTIRKWTINGTCIEQVKWLKYLGIIFHHKLSWAAHKQSIIQSAEHMQKAILSFFFFGVGAIYTSLYPSF